MSERSSWTDERMDDFVAHLTARFDQVDARFANLEARMDGGFARIEARLDRMDARTDRILDQLFATQRQIAVGAWAIVAVLVAQVVAFTITQA